MSTFVEGMAVAVQPWADLYAGSTVVSATVEFVHLGGLLVAGGFALAFDRAALRLEAGTTAERTRHVVELSEVHRPVLIALVLVMASGLALMLADAEVLMQSRIFWVKMAAFGLLLVNGLFIRHAGRVLEGDARNAARWRSLDRGAKRSMGLWILVVFLGVVLTGAA